MAWRQFIQRSVGEVRDGTRKVLRADPFSVPRSRELLSLRSPDDLKEFITGSDSDIGGFSTVNLDVDPSTGRGRFHGNLSCVVPSFESPSATTGKYHRVTTLPTPPPSPPPLNAPRAGVGAQGGQVQSHDSDILSGLEQLERGQGRRTGERDRELSREEQEEQDLTEVGGWRGGSGLMKNYEQASNAAKTADGGKPGLLGGLMTAGGFKKELPERMGYAGFRNRTRKSLWGTQTWDTSLYEYLWLRVRNSGDGMRYFVNIQTDGPVRSDVFQHRLHLGEPGKWSNVLLPLSDFTLTNAGEISEGQIRMMREKVRTVGISVLGPVEGPYELGVEAIGVENREEWVDPTRLD